MAREIRINRTWIKSVGNLGNIFWEFSKCFQQSW
uniref:Uncharacterized protein n=1 Tax=Arundo donax TaxID=35708 RepID=A0A0A9FD78_ARUDO